MAKKYNSNEALKRVRKRLGEMGLNKKRKFMHLVCKTCKKETAVRITHPELYTEEVIKNWECYSCSANNPKKK